MAKAKKAPRPRRPKQKEIPGMEANEKQIKVVEDAADNYDDMMHARIQANKEEKEAELHLLGTMAEHGIERYKMPDGRMIMITGTRKPKIVKPKTEKAQKKKAA